MAITDPLVTILQGTTGSGQLSSQQEQLVLLLPLALMAVGIGFLIQGVRMLVTSRRYQGWSSQQGKVATGAKANGDVEVQLGDGSTVRAVNGSGRTLKAGQKVWLVIDPDDPGSGRTLRGRGSPTTAAVVTIVTALFITGIGFALQIVLSAMES